MTFLTSYLLSIFNPERLGTVLNCFYIAFSGIDLLTHVTQRNNFTDEVLGLSVRKLTALRATYRYFEDEHSTHALCEFRASLCHLMVY